MKPIWLSIALLLCGQTWTGPQAEFMLHADDTRALTEDCDCGDEQPGGASGPEEKAPTAESQPRLRAGHKVEMDLFVMSLCPYGMAAEQILLPLAERFADQVELKIYFIADEAGKAAPQPALGRQERPGCTASSSTSGDGPFLSLHGQEEIDEGRRQLIVRADHPEHYHSYLLCRSRQGPEKDWTDCARLAGIDPDSLQSKAAGARGESLFRENILRANTLGINLSPTLLINGEEFSGDLYHFSLARRICRQHPDHESCRDIPVCGADEDCGASPGQVALCIGPDTPWARCEYHESVAFKLTVLKTPDCQACDAGAFLRTTTELFPQVQVETAFLETPAGEKLADRYDIRVFPAYIFDTGFARSPRFSRVRHMVVEKFNHYLLKPRIAATTYWRERPEKPGRLDVFVPAWIPVAEDEILSLWPRGDADIHLHHLLPPGQDDWLPEELARRVCLAAHQSKRYPVYVAALNKAPQDPFAWQQAAQVAGADLPALKACAERGAGQILGRTRDLVDSLQLDPETTSVLVGNRILIRHAQPREIFQLWQEGNEL